MKLLIDTNAYRDFCDGVATVVDTIQRARCIAMSFVTLGELRAGFLCGSRSQRNEATLRRFLDSERVEVLCADEQTTHHFAQIFFQLRRQGTPIPTNDIWIAALATQHGCQLCSRDGHFDRLPQIPRAGYVLA